MYKLLCVDLEYVLGGGGCWRYIFGNFFSENLKKCRFYRDEVLIFRFVYVWLKYYFNESFGNLIMYKDRW